MFSFKMRMLNGNAQDAENYSVYTDWNAFIVGRGEKKRWMVDFLKIHPHHLQVIYANISNMAIAKTKTSRATEK